jgi:hypothetical protein
MMGILYLPYQNQSGRDRMTLGPWPIALFGGPLVGDRAVKYIYVDEAGTSAKEAVSVVLGVIIDADKQWKLAEGALRELIGKHVPEAMRAGFISHAKTIFAGGRSNASWPLESRLAFLNEMMALPRQLNLPLALGICRRGSGDVPLKKLSAAQLEHVVAFIYFAITADKWMRREADEGEVATVICEDVDHVKEPIKTACRYYRDNPVKLSSDMLIETQQEKRLGKRIQNGEFAITRIVDTVHFVGKRDGPLLQIADACAFAFRRFFHKQAMGEDFVRSVLGRDFHEAPDWDGPASGASFQWAPPKIILPDASAILFRELG